MKIIRSILVSVALFAALTGTALAQEPEMITKTFELTINGTAPEGEIFVASVQYQLLDTVAENLLLCGGDADVECTGSGTVYRQSVEVPEGVTAIITVQRGNESDVDPNTVDIFAEGRETLTKDTTNRVSYTYPGVDDDQQEMPLEVPATGAGGAAAAGGVLYLYAGFAALCLLAAAGRSVLLRR